jgi:hypothetical protein
MCKGCVVLQVFIDTNVYLTFYSLASEDLEELRKLHTAIENGALRLIVPGQILDEVERNREMRFLESLQHVRAMRPKGGLPQMARDTSAFNDALAAVKEVSERINALEVELIERFDERNLGADRVLKELLDAALNVPITADVLDAARGRVEVGNPPGKRGSIGDAINWECLLAGGSQGDLHVVTGDGDYTSALLKERAKPYLVREWADNRHGDLRLYRRIAEFLNEHFPDIKLATELEKEIRIRALVDSGTFDSTHRAVGRLRQYSEYTPQQAADLLEAALSNSQIRWIARDPDVETFLRALVQEHPVALDEFDMKRLRTLLYEK